ncbi:amidase activity protein [Lysinibacillus phage vB_LfM_LysYB1]|nr:amidase activity protein [Lysinibacillus phage vB_LfM_LysYB1]WAB25248.1 amidase activity protein [Lysinibacillus phage vB_LfM_LysYB2]
MSQEVSIKLKADTREAVKSVKDLERQVSGLERVSQKGEGNKSFLSQDDVKQFRRMSQESERIYREFFDKLNRIQRDIDKKKRDLEAATTRNAGSSTTDAIQRDIRELEARRNMVSSQRDAVTDLYNRGQQSQQQINNMNTPGAFSSMMLGGGRNLIAAMGLTMAVGQLARFINDGARQVKADEKTMSTLGQRTGYVGNYHQGRKDAQEVGLRNGNAYNAIDTMGVADNYTSLAGFKSNQEMWNRTSEIQSASRILGVDANELSSTYGNLNKMGTLNDATSFKQFKESMIGAIKETGMAGRDREFIKAAEGLAVQVGEGQMSLSNSELKNIIGLQTAIGSSNEKGLQGEKGANVLGKLDAGVKGGNAAVDAILGWGTEFQGVSGRADLERLKAKGIGSREVQEKLAKQLPKIAGGNKDYQALFLQDNFGLSIEEADAMVKKFASGEFLGGKDKLSKAEEEAKKTAKDRSQAWQDSKSQRDQENDARWQNTKKWGGEKWRDIWEGGKEAFLSQPEALQWTEMGAAAIGGGILGGKAMGGLSRLLSGKVGAGGATKGAGMFSKAWGGLKSGGGKLLGPIGAALTMKSAGDLGSWLGDKTFGTTKGAPKDALRGTKYEETTQGWLSKGWDAVTPWDTAWEKHKKGIKDIDSDNPFLKDKKSSSTVSEAKAAAKEDARSQTLALAKEKEILDRRKSVNADQHTVLDKERKNLDDMKNMVGSESGSTNSSGGGFFSKLFGGIKSFFGGETAYAAGNDDGNKGTSYASNYTAVGKNANFMNQNLKQQSNMTAEDINKWIASKAPKDSLLQGKGDVFMKAAMESGLDPRYLVAHAAHETGWGTSNIAKKKSNFYGIGAFDATPYASSYGYNNTDAGIIEGAKWISKNYADKGQNTLAKMRNNGGKHEYATDPLWDDKIAGIMAGAPVGSGATKKTAWTNQTSSVMSMAATSSAGGRQVIDVNVSGKIDGLTKENNNKVAEALVAGLNGNSINLMYETRRGVGGNKS